MTDCLEKGGCFSGGQEDAKWVPGEDDQLVKIQRPPEFPRMDHKRSAKAEIMDVLYLLVQVLLQINTILFLMKEMLL